LIHEPTGKPITCVKGVIDGDEFTEVPEEEIVKGYEHTKGRPKKKPKVTSYWRSRNSRPRLLAKRRLK